MDGFTDTETRTDDNGKAPKERGFRVRFGDLPNQTVPAEWAESILRKLAQDRKKFGQYLTEAALGDESHA